jgi:hypothetical protein
MSEIKGKSTLYELSGKLEELGNLVDNLEGVAIPDEVIDVYQELLDELDKTQNDFADKVDDILALIQSRKKWVQIRKDECDRLQKTIRKDENTIKFLNEYLLRHLDFLEIQKLRTKKFNLTVASNGGKSPLWIDENLNPQDLPKKYQKVTIEFDRTAIRDDLEAGENLQFAGILSRGKHLKIN